VCHQAADDHLRHGVARADAGRAPLSAAAPPNIMAIIENIVPSAPDSFVRRRGADIRRVVSLVDPESSRAQMSRLVSRQSIAWRGSAGVSA
jgi:hypothetical protein